ncbi:MAG: LruC domain-containing protein, partial [Prevotella sp.]|nr:LruC domain-containing protein [Prevotella sp.]
TYTKVYSTANNAIYEEGYTFKTYTNAAKAEKLKSGVAVKVEGLKATDKIEFFVKKPGAKEFTAATFERDTRNNIIYLTDNAKSNIGTEYMFNVKHDEALGALYKGKQVKIKPFIYRDVDGKRLEIHIAQEAPTNAADKSFFGTEDDASQPDKKIFYVRSGNYPFGIFLNGATESDMTKLFDADNETRAIDEDEVYPKFKSWVENKGKKNPDWYK